ncbi:MAG TPA: glycosyltransferase family 87 protein [Terracidiphilus sp.]|nr:glycosyltransferase family 87 protein [Terracidiphilus sp.]
MTGARLDGPLLALLGGAVFLLVGTFLKNASSAPRKVASRTDVPQAKVRFGFADQAIAIVSGLSFVLVAVTVCTIPFTNSISGARDFVVYWATGQQLAHHANPYDTAALMQIQHAAGLSTNSSVGYMRNPPWALPLTLPLGLAGLRVGGFLWSMALLASLLVSVYWLWQLYGRPNNQRHWLGAAFAPAVICLLIGQTSLFALLGYVLFLRLHRSRPFWAGMSLWLCALKPHLFLVIGVVLLAWVLVSKSYRVLAGAAVAVAVSCMVAYWIDPAAWTQYATMMRESGINQEAIPCVSIVLRQRLSPKTMWLQYVPAILGCGWALTYFWQRRRTWDWIKEGNLVTLVSVLVAPYSWITDQVLVIPPLLDGAIRTRSQILLVILAAASIVIEAELLGGVILASNLYLWTAPAWLAWYLLARNSVSEPSIESKSS